MRRLAYFILLLMLSGIPSLAQINDQFTDGNYSEDPVWEGDTSKFEVNTDKKLHLTAPAESSQAYLSTWSEAIADAEWHFSMEISENPSSTNFAKIYLVSNNKKLDESLNGYFVKVGGATDEISLYRQEGTSEIKIIDGADGRVDTKPVKIHIKVTRDISGNWSLFSKPEGALDFLQEGAIFDHTFTSSSYFGIYCQYTSTRSQSFYFDDFMVTGSVQPDETPPSVHSLNVLSENQVTIRFSEELDENQIKNTSQYTLKHQHPSSVILHRTDSITLDFPFNFTNGEVLSLTIHSLTDFAGNMMEDTTITFLYFREVPATYRDIVMNEVLPDPNPQVDSLPADTNAEFIELYNRSQQPFNLNGWQINGKTLPEAILLPNTYIIVCRQEFLNNYQSYGNAIPMSSWPSLSNTGSTVFLTNPEGTLIDSLAYGNELVQGGYSIEQINPDQPCHLADNYAISTHPNGATPGDINTVFDNTVDTTGPLFQEVKATHSDTLILRFDEKVEVSSSMQIMLSPHVAVKEWRVENSTYAIKAILKDSLSTETHYHISVSGVEDCQGNSQGTQHQNFYFDNTPPLVSTIQWLDTAKIAVFFNEKVEGVSATNTHNYLLNPRQKPPTKIDKGTDSLSVHLLFDEAFKPSMDYELAVSGIKDVYGNAIDIPLIYPFRLESHIDTVIVADKNQLHIYFTKPPHETDVQNVLHYKVDQGVGYPKAAVVNKENPNLIYLIFDSPLAENKHHTLTISNLPDRDSSLLSTPVYRLYYDTKAPSITAVLPVDSLHLEVWFNEVLDDDLTNIQIEINKSIGYPIATTLQPDQQSIRLTLKNNLQHQTLYTLTLSGVADASGNRITSPREKSFLYDLLPPSLLSWHFVSPYQLKLIFDEPVTDSSAMFLDNYHVSGAGKPNNILVSRINPGTVFLYYSKPFLAEADLTIKNISDQQGIKLLEPILVKVNNKDLRIGSVECLSTQKIKVTFTKTIAPEVLIAQNFVLNNSIQAENIELDPEAPASLIVYFNLSFNPFEESQLLITSIQDAEGRNYDSLSGTFLYDPKVEKITINSPSSLEIRFNVPLQASSAEIRENFEVPGFGHPTAVVQSDTFTLKLFFHASFGSQQPYTLHILEFPHAEAGYIPASLHRFGLGETPQRFDLLITEIMADPSPAVSLPAADYLELYNPTDRIINLEGLRLSDESRTAIFPSTIMMPGEYVIVCAHSHYKLFASLGQTISLSSFPSLRAEGDHLILKREDGKVIFTLDYSNEWYNDAEKRKGGWSLEMIDTTRPCGELDNWTASKNVQGGTPGVENSVNMPNPDHRSPQMQQAVVLGDSSIQILFNEKVEPHTIRPANFSINENLTVKEVQFLHEKEVRLFLETAIPAGKEISLTAKHITDCAGNLIDGQALTFGKPEEAEAGDLLLSELLFNPRPGGVTFVEIYNNSNKYIDLQGWSLVCLDNGTLKDKKLITEQHLIVKPKQYLALTEDSKILKGDYPSTRLDHTSVVRHLPSLYVTEGTLALLSPTDSLMQLLHYSEDLHHPMIKVKKGVSLERITWLEPSDNPEHWQSAASLVGFATPGFLNSQMMQQKMPEGMISIDPKIFSPGYTGSHPSGLQNYTRIQYQMKETGDIANICIFDSKGRKVRDLIQNQTLAQEGFLVWDGTDNFQKPVPLGYYIILMEVYHPQGGVQVFKEKVVVGSLL